MFNKVKEYQFEKILNHFKKYEKNYCITIEQKNDDISVLIESKVKPSKPPKRATTEPKTSKTNKTTKKD